MAASRDVYSEHLRRDPPDAGRLGLDESSDAFLAENGEDFPGGDHLHLRLPIPLTKPRGPRDDAQ